MRFRAVRIDLATAAEDQSADVLSFLAATAPVHHVVTAFGSAIGALSSSPLQSAQENVSRCTQAISRII